MKIWLPILLFMAGCGSACAYPAPDYEAARKATVRIEMLAGVCSGTAIGHHTLLSAEHCTSEGVTGWVVNGRTVVITKVVSDGADHVLLTTDVYFKDIARMGSKPKQGDSVFGFGNPAGVPGMLQVGYVSGWVGEVMMLDRPGDWYGCSGAAVFDRYGRVVGVVNAVYPFPIIPWRMTAIFPLKFTDEQLAS